MIERLGFSAEFSKLTEQYWCNHFTNKNSIYYFFGSWCTLLAMAVWPL